MCKYVRTLPVCPFQRSHEDTIWKTWALSFETTLPPSGYTVNYYCICNRTSRVTRGSLVYSQTNIVCHVITLKTVTFGTEQ